MSDRLPAIRSAQELPPILVGRDTPDVRRRVEGFYVSVADIFEKWVQRRPSPHTQRAYRRDVMSFVEFLGRRWPEGFRWPDESFRFLQVTVGDVLAWRDDMHELELAPKTLNRRVSSVSSFYKYLAGAAAELRLPITVPNPAHAQFVSREAQDPRYERRALTATRARQLMGLPTGEGPIPARDRAILKLFIYTGIRLGTGCRLNVSDFHADGEEATLRLNEKGNRHRTIGIHFAAAESIREYMADAGVDHGPLFRARLNPRSAKLGKKRISPASMYRIIQGYLDQLPGAVKEAKELEGSVEVTTRWRVYTPHSLRATTATLLLDAGVDITKVQELLGHRHITTTQIYDKRRRTTKESASHDVPV